MGAAYNLTEKYPQYNGNRVALMRKRLLRCKLCVCFFMFDETPYAFLMAANSTIIPGSTNWS